MNNTQGLRDNTEGRKMPYTSEVLIGTGIFLIFNFIVAAIYFHIVNP